MRRTRTNTPEEVREEIWKAKKKRLKRLTLNHWLGEGDDQIPIELFELEHLEDLDLSNHRITFVPRSIAKLRNLTSLDLQDNSLTSFPGAVCELKKLEYLNLGDNKIVSVPKSISKLENLTHLSLYRCRLVDIPRSIINLKKLKRLELWNNEFRFIPEVLYELVSLEYLSFTNSSTSAPQRSDNQIREISPKIIQSVNLKDIDLAGNPIENPPSEVVARGIESIKDYFRQLESEGKDYLYEAKLLIVGEGGAGKTSLAKKIENPKYELKDEDSTKGIEVIPWTFKMQTGQSFRVNIWDFGGQEIYHATHQFFLTKRSLYVLVADTRKEDTDFYYWLNAVELLSNGSPLLIVKNEKQDRHREINERQLRGQFSNLKETLATNLADNRGLDEVLIEIKHHITHLPIVGAPLPKTWVRVREH